jgi:hypothetical protein
LIGSDIGIIPPQKPKFKGETPFGRVGGRNFPVFGVDRIGMECLYFKQTRENSPDA